MIGCANGKNTFPCNLLLTHTQVPKTRRAFANGSSANTKFSKNQLSKTVPLGRFILGPSDISNLTARELLSLLSSIAKE